MSLSPVLSLSPEFYSFFFHMPFETWQVHNYRIGYIYCAFALKVCLIRGGLYASCGGVGIAVDFDVSVVIQRIEIVNHERVIPPSHSPSTASSFRISFFTVTGKMRGCSQNHCQPLLIGFISRSGACPLRVHLESIPAAGTEMTARPVFYAAMRAGYLFILFSATERTKSRILRNFLMAKTALSHMYSS